MTTDVIPILRVAEVSRAVEWYGRLGFVQVFAHRLEPHLPAYVGIRRDDAQIPLSEHAGDLSVSFIEFGWSGRRYDRTNSIRGLHRRDVVGSSPRLHSSPSKAGGYATVPRSEWSVGSYEASSITWAAAGGAQSGSGSVMP